MLALAVCAALVASRPHLRPNVVQKARTALAAEEARLHVWQGRLAEAGQDADAAEAAYASQRDAAEHRDAREQRTSRASAAAARLRVAKLRLHAKDLDERAAKEWAQAESLNATLHGLERARLSAARPTADIAPALRKLRAVATSHGGEDAAALAEANASAVHAERLAAEAELASLAQEEQRVSQEVAAAEHHVAVMRADLAAQPDPVPLMQNWTETAAREVVEAANATHAPAAEATHAREPAAPLPSADTQVPTEATAVAQLEQQLVSASEQRAQVEAERQQHLQTVEAMNATLGQLEARSAALSSTLATVA